jgi:Tc5 transposase DNA-binding domain
MPRPKDPERAETEARLQQAITEYKKRQKQAPNDSKSSLRRVATDFNVSRDTLKACINGRLPRNKAHEELMHLTIQEEKELAHWITTLTQHGYAPRYRTVRELAEIIRNRRVFGVNDDDVQLVNYEQFGKDWVPRFMSRHSQLKRARIKLIEAARIKDVSVQRLTK